MAANESVGRKRPSGSQHSPSANAARRNSSGKGGTAVQARRVQHTGTSRGQQTSRKRRKKKSKAPIIALTALIIFIAAIVAAYVIGYLHYKNRFTANTLVNGENVSGMTYEEALKLFEHEEIPDNIEVSRPNGEIVKLSLSDVDYKYSYDTELKKIFDSVDRKSWFAAWFAQTEYSFTDAASYDKDKLNEEIESADWGSEENVSAAIKSNDDGYYVVEDVQGDVFDMDTLKSYIASNLDNAVYTLKGTDSGAYIAPDTVASDYDKKLETLNKMWDVKLYYNFDYTKELLTGKTLCRLIKVKRDGTYTVDEDACMKYIEKLADKYDTYNTKRKFKATIQGNITVPTSSDAKYGWWLDQQQCCDQLVGYLEKGKSQDSIDPIYYSQGNFTFTGLASARSEDDDIGNTYVEVDLTNQQFWYYKKGKLKRHGYIVSGQTTSEARTTLPGVYKVWQKATNYRMKDTNADGDSWDTTCNYWTRIAIVGIGMHDSTWRGAFGGEIYKYNGSHGCINMTYSDAQYIHDKVAMNTPVVMYY